MSWEQVVNVASAAWKIVESGKPSASVDHTTCNAVPHVDDWTNLQGARGPNIVRRLLRYTNGFTMDTVLVRLELRWEFGARYNNAGAFIPNCWISVPECSVLWGYSLDLHVQVHNPTNAGSSTAPNARLPLTISGSVSTPFWTDTVQWDYILFGDGHYES
ncbi:hypothetical protein ACNTMW_32850 [Planosporangium sp. 12N6]|uniref:hypothetical protein n=1 Tax=Planosporangium spinosum TaxID=3402278 RepID=UPI003CF0E844